MPATVQVKVVAARDLPIMDRSSELTDAFVELRLGHSFEKTEVCDKTLSPVWDSKWFIFRMDEEDLQEEPLQVRVMDHDTYSSHNAIGRVYVPLTIPPVSGAATQHSGHIDGWFPIYDTLHGIRGEVRLMVKVDILKDQHRFRQSSYGIMFFVCPQTPSCYITKAIHGFVEELVVNDDPEYKWIDRIRTPRASNEARQLLFSKLTGELQRKIGLKALEVGGNAVIGYQQCFDLEGDTGIVVRGIGTCVSLVPRQASAGIGPASVQLPANIQSGLLAGKGAVHLEEYLEPSVDIMSPKQRMMNRKTSSSDSDGPSSPARTAGSALNVISHHGDLGSAGSSHPSAGIRPVPSTSDFPFYTLTNLPPGVLSHLGGVVSSRSVKLLDKIKDPDEPETRDAWWQEVRNEVKAHAQAYGCNAILGYSESTSICDTLCILSASGTAVCIGSPAMQQRKQISPGSSIDERDMELKESGSCLYPHKCSVCHVPYSPAKLPFQGQLTNCAICSSHLVPSVILSTAEPPDTPIRGRGTLIQVRVVLPKSRKKGEENAIFVSKQLPFLEYRLYTRLLNKARVKGMNSVFCLQIQYTIGDTIIIGMATGTSLYLEALPPPCKLSISDKEKSSNVKQLVSIQEALNRSQESNVQEYGLSQPLDIPKTTLSDITVAEEEKAPLDLSLGLGGQEAFVFDVEDHMLKEEDIMELILDRPLPKDFHATNTHLVPGIHPTSLTSDFKMIAMVTKKSLEPGKQHLEKQCTQLFGDLHQALAFKVRRSGPCLVTRIRYDLDLPEDDMLQIAITAMVTRMKASTGSGNVHNSHSDEMIFCMEEFSGLTPTSVESCVKEGGREDTKTARAVRITPLPFICGSQVEQYLRIINFFVIRESTSIRESGGLDSFMHLFTLEALAIARAHVAALGGNALLNFRLNDCVLIEHPHKNQAQCLLNVSGDAAVLSAAPPHCQFSTSTTAASVATSVSANATTSIGQSTLGTQSPTRTKATSLYASATTSDGKLATPSQRISLPTSGKKKGD